MRNDSIQIILLDAMGVIYESGDDVAELLVPFIQERGSAASVRHIEETYRQASLGALTAHEFWQAMGLPPDVEDAYLERHRLVPGLTGFLDWAAGCGLRVACLSNDVSVWSAKLRRRFGLEKHFEEWIISGDVKLRKPDRRIYGTAAAALDVAPHRILFVDDREANVRAAREAGFRALLFGAASGEPGLGFDGLRDYLSRGAGTPSLQ